MRFTCRSSFAATALAASLILPAAAATAQPTDGSPSPEAVARFCVEGLRHATEFVRERIAETTQRAISVLRRLDEHGASEEALRRFAKESKAHIRRFGGHAVEVFDRFAAQCLEFLRAAGAPDALLRAMASARDDAIAAVRRAVERACDAIESALANILMDRLDGGLEGEDDPALAA